MANSLSSKQDSPSDSRFNIHHNFTHSGSGECRTISLRSAREHSSDPLSPVFNRYLTELAQVRNQQRPTTDPDSQRVLVPSRSRLKYYDCFNQQQVDNVGRIFYYPLEPDFNNLTIWLRCDYTGNKMHDYSCFDNHASIFGDPRLVEGLSYGQYGGNIALQMDGEEDYFVVPEGINGAGRITSLASGFSVCSIIYPQDLQNVFSQKPFFFRKVDDDSGNYGYSAQILEDGKIVFASKINGGLTRKETTLTPLGDPQAQFKDYFDDDYNPLDWNAGPPNYFVVPGWYIVWFVSDQANPPNVNIYVNGSLQTLQNSSVDSTLNAGGTDHSTIIGAAKDATYSWFPGIYQEYRFMKRQVTAQEVTNHNINKLSISPIAYGQVFTVGATVFGPEPSIFLDGVNDYVNCGNDASLWSKSLGTQFSFSIWVYPTTAWDGNDRWVVLHGSGNQRFQIHLPSAGPTGRAIFRMVDSGGNAKDASIDTVALNQWNQLIGSYNSTLGSDNVRIYRNGVIGGVKGQFTGAINQSANLLIGNTGTNNTIQGYVSEFMFWDNDSFNTTEASDFYNLGTLISTPVYWLPMLEGFNDPIDAISFTKTGVLTNGARWEYSI